VKINYKSLLHYVLIILLMFAPLRSVMAMQVIHCDMDNYRADSSAVISDSSSAHDMSAMSVSDYSTTQKVSVSHSCCSGSNQRLNHCDMSLSASLLLQESSYLPNFITVSATVTLIVASIEKAFSPPFRPPLVFHR